MQLKRRYFCLINGSQGAPKASCFPQPSIRSSAKSFPSQNTYISRADGRALRQSDVLDTIKGVQSGNAPGSGILSTHSEDVFRDRSASPSFFSGPWFLCPQQASSALHSKWTKEWFLITVSFMLIKQSPGCRVVSCSGFPKARFRFQPNCACLSHKMPSYNE